MADLAIYDTCTRQYGYNHGEVALQFDQDAISRLQNRSSFLGSSEHYGAVAIPRENDMIALGWERSYIPPMKDLGIILLGTF